MKNILCKIGLHRPDKSGYVQISRKRVGGKWYHRNYIVCSKCGKKLYTVKMVKE